MFFTVWEVVQALVMTAIVGWIFKDAFMPRQRTPDQILRAPKAGGKEAFIFATLLVAPAIILHELGHKFVALAFGLTAEFHAAWLWLAIGIIMKVIGGFIFFVPAFVSIGGSAPHWVFGVIALAGPAVNFALYGIGKLVPWYKIHHLKHAMRKKELTYWLLFARINLFLGAFNLIPIPGFDGFQFFYAIFKTLTGA